MPAATSSSMIQPQRAVPVASTQRQKLVQAVISLYDLTGDVQAVVSTFYSPSPATRFNDPLVHVTGREDIVGQFRALQAAFRLAGDKVQVKSVAHGERSVVIDWRITYVVRGVPTFLEPLCAVTLPIQTVLTLDEAASLVLYHDDHWSVHELVGSIPLVGAAYRLAKRVTGKTTSALTNFCWMSATTTATATAIASPTVTTASSAPPVVAVPSPSSTTMGSLGSAAPPSDATLAVSSAAERTARGISSGTITSVASSGGRSSIASGGVPALEEEKAAGPASD